jgi:predicted DNA-binding transcriptional regulator AlpA
VDGRDKPGHDGAFGSVGRAKADAPCPPQPDSLVSLADIATRTGLSRAAITQYSKGQRSADFPSPVARVTSETSLYDWSQVATWLYQHEKLSRDQAIEATAVKVANEVLGANRPKLRDTLRKRLKSYEATLEAA